MNSFPTAIRREWDSPLVSEHVGIDGVRERNQSHLPPVSLAGNVLSDPAALNGTSVMNWELTSDSEKNLARDLSTLAYKARFSPGYLHAG